MTTELAKSQSGPLAVMKQYLSDDSVKKRLEETLGKRAGAFSNSIINVFRNSASLQKCTPSSVMSAAMVAATMNLPIDPALGQAAIVPYGNQAVFQLMYKGVTQLCIRSGQYATIHCSEIYRDELKSHNPITGIVTFHDPSQYKLRYGDKNIGDVAGHYAYFKLCSGFEKSDYMTHTEVMAHAKKYSKAYQSGKKDGAWFTDPIAMGNKTVLLRLLKKYGVMSIEMQDALISDRDTFEATQAEATERIATEAGSLPMDAEFEQPTEPAKPAAKGRKKKTAKKKVESTEVPKFKWHCQKCGIKFDEPRGAGPDGKTLVCPEIKCGSLQIVETKPEFLSDD